MQFYYIYDVGKISSLENLVGLFSLYFVSIGLFFIVFECGPNKVDIFLESDTDVLMGSAKVCEFLYYH